MYRAMDQISGIPKQLKSQEFGLRKFLVAMLQVIIFTPDRNISEADARLRDEFEEYFGPIGELEIALEEDFFERIYVDRHEREELEDLFALQRFIFLYGHFGSGKTILLRKIANDIEHKSSFTAAYFDFMEISPDCDATTLNDFENSFKVCIFDRIYDQHIASANTEFKNQWLEFKINHDKSYRGLKQKIVEYAGHLRTSEDWQKILNDPQVKNLVLEHDNGSPDLFTLLKFLKPNIAVLIIDNVDRETIEKQWAILSVCLDIEHAVKMPVVMAVRETNLRRLIAEATDKRQDALPQHYVVSYLEKLDPRNGDREDVFELPQAEHATVKRLLQNRLRFLHEKINDSAPSFPDLVDYINSFLEQSDLGDDQIRRDFSWYLRKFWESFDDITEVFTDDKMKAFMACNSNIRELQKLYFSFISTVMLNPEEQYSFDSLFRKRIHGGTTKLRTFFYKWLICDGRLIPPAMPKFPNIFTFNEPGLKMLPLRILEYVYNWEKRNPNRRLRFDRIWGDFRSMGIDREVLRDQIVAMGENHGFQELGLIWINWRKKGNLTNNTTFELLPSGEHFVEVISTTREYAFWNVLSAYLPIQLLETGIPFEDTYSDSIKYQLILDFCTQVLIPQIKEEMDYFENSINVPRRWNKSNNEYYKSMFTVNGYAYTHRLLRSVISTVEYSDLYGGSKRDFRTRFVRLMKKIEKIYG